MTISRKTATIYLGTIAITGLVTAAAIMRLHGKLFPLELSVGWALALINLAMASWINRRAIHVKAKDCFTWGLGMNGARSLLLLAIIACTYFVGMPNFAPFLTTVLISYFCLTFGEIICLHLESIV